MSARPSLRTVPADRREQMAQIRKREDDSLVTASKAETALQAAEARLTALAAAAAAFDAGELEAIITQKWIALFGSVAQLALAFVLFFIYKHERETGNAAQMLFEQNYPLFKSLNINFHLGVDGISIAMILLTAFVVVAGVLVSWNIEKMTKEFYFLLILLGMGAYGFFISLDLFILFFFLEISVIPKYLLIGIWGSGKKEYSANKLALMLMGGSALILVGILGLYFAAGRSFDIMELSKATVSLPYQQVLFPLLFVGFGVFTALFPLHTWVPAGPMDALLRCTGE